MKRKKTRLLWWLAASEMVAAPSFAHSGIKQVFPGVRCCRLFAKKKLISAAAASALSAALSEWIKHQSGGSPALLHSVIFTEAARQRACDFKISALRWSRGWNSNWVSVCVWVTPLPTLPSCSYFLGQLWQWHPVFVGLPVNHYLSLCVSAACGSMIGPQCPFREDN